MKKTSWRRGVAYEYACELDDLWVRLPLVEDGFFHLYFFQQGTDCLNTSFPWFLLFPIPTLPSARKA